MGNNRLLLIILGGLAIMLILAVFIISAQGHEPPISLTVALGSILGALVALANPSPPRGP